MKSLFFETNLHNLTFNYINAHTNAKEAEVSEALLRQKEKDWGCLSFLVRPLFEKSVQTSTAAVLNAIKNKTPLFEKLKNRNIAIQKKAIAKLLPSRLQLLAKIQGSQAYILLKDYGFSNLSIEQFFSSTIGLLRQNGRSKLSFEKWAEQAGRQIVQNWKIMKGHFDIYSGLLGKINDSETLQRAETLLKFLKSPDEFSAAEQQAHRHTIKDLLEKFQTMKESLPKIYEKQPTYAALPRPLRELMDALPQYPRQRFSTLIRDPGPFSPRVSEDFNQHLKEHQNKTVELEGRRHSVCFKGSDLRMCPVTVTTPSLNRARTFRTEDFPFSPQRPQIVRDAVLAELIAHTENKDPDYLILGENLVTPLFECNAEAIFTDLWIQEFNPSQFAASSQLLSKSMEYGDTGIKARFHYSYRLFEGGSLVPLEKHLIAVECFFEKDPQGFHLSHAKWDDLGPSEITEADHRYAGNSHSVGAPSEHFDDEGIVERPD
jgi:hypothetical protein